MVRRLSGVLSGMVERMVRFSPPRHRELLRGMVAELDSIAEPAERARFAVGAVAAMARLALIEFGRSPVRAFGRLVGVGEADDTICGGLSVVKPTPPQLLGRHIAPFAVSFALLTALMLAQHVARWVPRLLAREAPAGAVLEAVLLAVPHTVALTIPMAVFLAVSWAFARLGTQGILAAARRERSGIRRLVAPVLAAVGVIAALSFVSNAEVVPRANARLAAVIRGAPVAPTDRTMTISELRDASRRAQAATGVDAPARAAAYQVEVQKKLALAAASTFLALVGIATAIRFPLGGLGLMLGTGVVVFLGYYSLLIMGESLADRQVLSPLIAMWSPNVTLLAVALGLGWRPRRPAPHSHRNRRPGAVTPLEDVGRDSSRASTRRYGLRRHHWRRAPGSHPGSCVAG